nr:unnamed protein product [Callosobruchus analis]
MQLVGAAKYWLAAKPEVCDWPTFKYAIQKTFLFRKSKTEQWKAMQNCVQRSKEQASTCFIQKITLCKSLGLTFSETKEQVTVGLYSRELSTYIMSKQHIDEDDLYQDLMTYERIDVARKERINEERNKIQKKESKVYSSEVGISVPKPTQVKSEQYKDARPPLRNSNGEYKCYNCSEYGRIARDCTKEMREIKWCGEVGHTPRTCQKPKAASNVMNICKKSGETVLKYIKTVTPHNREYTGLIDTGSSDCTIKASSAISGDFEIVKNVTELKGFGNTNNTVKTCGEIRAQMTIYGVSAKEVLLRIVPDDVQPVEIIVGISYTDLDNIAYYKIGEKLEFKYKNILTYLNLNPAIQ